MGVDLKFPSISGEVAGDMTPLALPCAPKLHWEVKFLRLAGDVQQADLKISGSGTNAVLAAQLNGSAPGRWRLVEGRIDLATWMPAAAIRLPMLDGIEISGTMMLSGEGDFVGTNVRGHVLATLLADHAAMPSKNIDAEGIALGIELDSLMPAVTAAGQVLTIQTVRAAGITLHDVRVVFALAPGGEVHVEEASLAVLGGRVSLAPFATAVLKPEIATTVIVEMLSLAELAPFFPKSISAAQGRLHGQVAVTWSEAAGFAPGHGTLALDRNEIASVRLAPAPGFLSSRVPAHLKFLPPWAGPLQRWFSADNPTFTVLHSIEMGDTPLVVQFLTVQLGPSDGVEGRTASLRMISHPPNSDVVKKVGFDINIAGPLTDVMALGLKQKISIKAH